MAISHAPVFGWAKPVPVNYGQLRNPRRDMVLVALAGPVMNLLLALIGTAILAVTIIMSDGARAGASAIVAANALNFVLINIFLAVFKTLRAISPRFATRIFFIFIRSAVDVFEI